MLNALFVFLPSRKLYQNIKSAPKIHVNPEFIVTREEPTKYIIVLENSLAMNFNNSWELLRTALRKFIKKDLEDPETQVGLVLFNEDASVQNIMVKIGEKENSKSRSDLSVKIPHGFYLSPRTNSCIRCGIIEAIQALEVRKLKLRTSKLHTGVLAYSSVPKSQWDKNFNNYKMADQLKLKNCLVIG